MPEPPMMPRTAFVIRPLPSVDAEIAGTRGLSCFAAEVRHGFVQHAVDRRAFAAIESAVELGKPAAHHLDRRAYRGGGDHADNADIDARLFAREQDFVEPFAGPDAGEHDVDVAARLEPAQANHALGEIDDLDRLP